jgi:mRNA interferase MazF
MIASGRDAASTPVRRGEIWWVNFDPTQGGEIRKTRPAVVFTADALNLVRRTVVVVPLSTGPQPRPPLVVATPSAGANSVAVCDQIRAVDKRRLTRTQGRLSEVDLRSVEDGLRRILEL